MPVLHLGDCLDILRTMPPNSVDAVVTDPPYGLAFMGKRWDYDVPSVEVWAECLRVLKPGGHLLAFAGTRTQHRMACRIEDAGFEIRDMIAWVYGSGCPKSLDVSKAIDKLDASEAQQARRHRFTEWVRSTGLTSKQINEATGTRMGSHYITAASQPMIMTREHLDAVRHLIGYVPEWVERECEIRSVESENFNRREVVATAIGTDTAKVRFGMPGQGSQRREYAVTAPATPEAQCWQGWGTALKPALEPVTVARRPCDRQSGQAATTTKTVLRWGTGAINIDAARGDGKSFPSNFIHDGSDEPTALLGDAARFFYSPKASKEERQGVSHPTVKPLNLMAYLCRLVTPPGGIVLDPFMGSGTTIKAAISEGFQAIGIERDPEYFEMAQHRLNGAQLGLGIA
jgi:site-specific DNA-methyltransferase (adenine-specific)